MVHIEDDQGNEGWGEQHISPGSSSETRDGGWTFSRVISSLILNKTIHDAKEIIFISFLHKYCCFKCNLYSNRGARKNDVLNNKRSLKLKLLTSFNAEEESEIKDELDKVTEQGFTTIKLKLERTLMPILKR